MRMHKMATDWITHSLRRGWPSRPRRDPMLLDRRNRVLDIIGGLWPHQILDTSVGGRMAVIEHLEERDRNCRRVWRDAPASYDKSFHTMILAELASERRIVAHMIEGVKPTAQKRLGEF